MYCSLGRNLVTTLSRIRKFKDIIKINTKAYLVYGNSTNTGSVIKIVTKQVIRTPNIR